MKTLLRAATAVAALALSTPAFAQQAAQQHVQPQFGVGVGLTTGPLSGAATAAGTPGTASSPDLGILLFVPVQFGQFRVEPFLGWARSDTDAAGQSSDFTIGVGGFFVQPLATQLQLYAGGRLGSRWVSDKQAGFGPAGTFKHERRDTLLALAAGGEYLPIPRVALGAEFQIGYVSVGDTKATNGNGTSTEGGGGSGSATQATLFARIYLF
jgi:hypothetical protein